MTEGNENHQPPTETETAPQSESRIDPRPEREQYRRGRRRFHRRRNYNPEFANDRDPGANNDGPAAYGEIGDETKKYQGLSPIEELTTNNPNRRIKLETVPERYTTRIMDLMTPLGMGQRGLIVAPPRTGKTTLLHHIADAVVKNHPEMKVIILLVDERPEEVTDFKRSHPKAEIIASSNDSDIKSHTRIAQLAT